MKALVRPVKDIADAIQRQDAKWLTTLPGIGPATAEQMVAKLRRKVIKFALQPDLAPVNGAATAPSPVAGNVLEDAYQALVSVGHSPAEARDRLDRVLVSGQTFTNVEEVLFSIYKQK
jgi:holliday junction DNA helicase RuvA